MKLTCQIQTFNKIKHILGSVFFVWWHVATWKMRKKGCDSLKGFYGGGGGGMAQSNHISRIYIF